MPLDVVLRVLGLPGTSVASSAVTSSGALTGERMSACYAVLSAVCRLVVTTGGMSALATGIIFTFVSDAFLTFVLIDFVLVLF